MKINIDKYEEINLKKAYKKLINFNLYFLISFIKIVNNNHKYIKYICLTI